MELPQGNVPCFDLVISIFILESINQEQRKSSWVRPSFTPGCHRFILLSTPDSWLHFYCLWQALLNATSATICLISSCQPNSEKGNVTPPDSTLTFIQPWMPIATAVLCTLLWTLFLHPKLVSTCNLTFSFVFCFRTSFGHLSNIPVLIRDWSPKPQPPPSRRLDLFPTRGMVHAKSLQDYPTNSQSLPQMPHYCALSTHTAWMTTINCPTLLPSVPEAPELNGLPQSLLHPRSYSWHQVLS
jgi:hypothetical protein